MSNIKAKNRQTSRNKAYYQRFRSEYSGKLICRRTKREKNLAFFAENPLEGSPSQVILRRKSANKKQRKKKTPK